MELGLRRRSAEAGDQSPREVPAVEQACVARSLHQPRQPWQRDVSCGREIARRLATEGDLIHAEVAPVGDQHGPAKRIDPKRDASLELGRRGERAHEPHRGVESMWSRAK